MLAGSRLFHNGVSHHKWEELLRLRTRLHSPQITRLFIIISNFFIIYSGRSSNTCKLCSAELYVFTWFLHAKVRLRGMLSGSRSRRRLHIYYSSRKFTPKIILNDSRTRLHSPHPTFATDVSFSRSLSSLFFHTPREVSQSFYLNFLLYANYTVFSFPYFHHIPKKLCFWTISEVRIIGLQVLAFYNLEIKIIINSRAGFHSTWVFSNACLRFAELNHLADA